MSVADNTMECHADSDLSTYYFLQIDCDLMTLCSKVSFTNLAQLQASLDLQIRFVNNTAGKAGSTIWGGSVEDCFLISTNERSYQSGLVDLFQIEYSHSDQTSIASPLQSICYCNASNTCTNTFDPIIFLDNETIITFPGQVVSITIGVIGQMNGFVPALIQTKSDSNYGLTLEQFQQTQRIVEAKCTTLSYTFYTSKKPDPGVDKDSQSLLME